jgi:phosphomannomutase
MSLILEMLAASNKSIGQFRDELPSYHMLKTQISCRPRDVAPAIRLLRYFYRDSQQDLTDGVRILWPDRWIHVRGSNTEPVIRVVAEAETKETALEMVDEVMDYMRPATGV